MCNRLVNELEKYNILYKHRYGFRSKHSTIHPILHLLKDIADANDNISKEMTMAVFLDLSKASDTINHVVLLYKSCHYGIRGISNKWFSSYLSNRKQYIEINECKSRTDNINSRSTTIIHIWTCAFSNLLLMIYQIRPLLTFCLLLMIQQFIIQIVILII